MYIIHAIYTHAFGPIIKLIFGDRVCPGKNEKYIIFMRMY